MNQSNQRLRTEKCDSDQVFSFIAEVPEIFLKQLFISKSQHLSQLVVLFSTAFISASPSHILSPCVFFKLLCALVVLVLMSKIGLLSFGLPSVSFFRNTSSVNGRVWLYFLFVCV